MMENFKYFLVIMFSSSALAAGGCRLQNDNSTLCVNLELKTDVPIQTNHTTSEKVYLQFSEGSISAITLSPFQEAELFMIYSSDIKEIEDGAICSLPKLKEIIFKNSNIVPVLRRGIFKGCEKVERLDFHNRLEVDALYELTGLKDLSIGGPLPSNFSKAYLEPLKNLRSMLLEIKDLSNIERGFYCTSPVIEDVQLYIRSRQEITKESFEGCSSLKKVYIAGSRFAEGTAPFKNFSHLEEMKFIDTKLPHLTKDFLSGLRNLKTLGLSNNDLKKIDGDAFTVVPHLTSLELSANELQNSDLEALHPLSDLVVLNLLANIIDSIDSLPELPNLELLRLEANSIKKFNIEDLKKKSPKLKEINLRSNPLSPESKDELDNEKSIKVLYGYPSYPTPLVIED